MQVLYNLLLRGRWFEIIKLCCSILDIHSIVRIFCWLSFIIILGCSGRSNLAPVAELRWHAFSRFQTSHVVLRGETLYAIAFRYDTDYRHLAQLNHLRYPYALRVGQVLNLRGLPHKETRRRSLPPSRPYNPYINPPHKTAYVPIFSRSQWVWPLKGRVATSFFPEQGKKGINIAGVKGQKVVAASNGVVAYAGSGLEGYGNLIILKHSNEYLTAYSNSSRNFVREGQQVKQGQAIAEVGILERKYWGVHFEIRKAGRPVNPLGYLRGHNS